MLRCVFLATSAFLLAAPCFAIAQTAVSVAVEQLQLKSSTELDKVIGAAARRVLEERRGSGMKDEHLAVSVIDLNGDGPYPAAHFNGELGLYPASVVKMFYLVAVHQQLEDGEIQDSKELRRALRDMIVESSNDATHYVVDTLTGTSSGVELPEAEMKEWAYKRNRVNRYFASLGYQGINVNQKTYCEDAYGRESQFRGAGGANRNKLTSSATARLLAEIALGKAVNPARSKEMMKLLKRDPYASGKNVDGQSRNYTGRAVNGLYKEEIPGVKLWSKAGWTNTTRHDAAYVELPGGRRFVIAVFTINRANDMDIIRTIARDVIDHFRAVPVTAH